MYVFPQARKLSWRLHADLVGLISPLPLCPAHGSRAGPHWEASVVQCYSPANTIGICPDA
ncbi:hypothetical protein PF005_g25069 [Phytophthora fragariae]|uniref:Uncharacterized protein n=1 Tax=Phytophthora fragariae TaxID=53985 RepID=A0A6A4BXB9_9STRA|nr:hypothetical protein PF009_g26251 [Phytophthora fragariae]KAE8974216.1 hypothetical protein PF011_g24950 [Phytophthora fragariae]KAE9066354.1 hypothetical protein PF010_g27841 [Phytophthora fragariae]KAE9075626.1 hypothetical protein PF007_g24926 [Phytophthora fragariae]KAE9087890.1 hypothetical protein PF006_g25705 [Phytophthora fragariae]